MTVTHNSFTSESHCKNRVPRFGSLHSILALLGLWLAAGCANTPAPLTADNILVASPPRAALQPSDGDLATRDLVRAALLSRRDEMDRSLAALEQIAEAGGEPNRKFDRRIPMSVDLINATLDDPLEYRAACKALKKASDLDPRLESRLEECSDDDYLRLAQRRVWDSRETLWAQTYNAVAEPLSQSLLSGGILAPYYIATSIANYLAQLNERDPFPVQLRQALVHRERFLARFPDSEEVPAVQKKVDRAKAKLAYHESRKLSFRAKVALDNRQIHFANYLAGQALQTNPENREAATVSERSRAAIDRRINNQLRSLGSELDTSSEAMNADAARASALLLSGSGIARHGRTFTRTSETRAIGQFMLAAALHESGRESPGWERLRELSTSAPRDNRMARHAQALLFDPDQNPYGGFRRVESRQNSLKRRWRIFGPFFQGPRYRRLPKPIAWLMDLPAVVNTVIFSPVRLILSPMSGAPDFKAPVAVAGYRYLERHPGGEHMDELANWLFRYESDNKNWNGALRLADYLPKIDPESREELVEKAAQQRIDFAFRGNRRDRRNSVLRGAAREYPDSEAGHEAGLAAREELENVSAQNIRMTRGFLIENPQVSGAQALGIRSELIDGKNENGELHPRGVTFLGARYMEFEFLAESGDDEAPPIRLRRRISEERLARLVAILDDTVHRNMRVDPDMDAGADPRRDLFLERARLGLANDPDMRATAQSTYVYESARERYGMVRGRESVLPFDLVVRGDFSTLGIAAFPRWRKPRETPDAFLYR